MEQPSTPIGPGTWWIAPTPFDDAGRVDAASLTAAVGAAVDWGVDGVTVLGVMGEVASLDDAERADVLAATASATAGRVPFAVGCSAPSPVLVTRRAEQAREAGASAAMVAAPPLVRDTDAVLAFFAAVGADRPLPVLVQDEPVATGVTMPVTVLLQALDACSSRMVKLEDAPTPPKISKLLARDPDLVVFGGLGGVSAYSELLRGASGTMTGFAYPEVLKAVRLALAAGDRGRAAAVFDAFLPLIAFEGQIGVGLPIRKEVLRRRGALATGRVRGTVPGPGIDAATAAELDDVFARVGLVPSRDRLDVDALLASRTTTGVPA